MAGREDSDRLINAVLLVSLEVFHPAFLNQFDDPTRIEVDTEADATAILSQVLDRQPQTSRAGWSKHQPVGALWKILLWKRIAKERIVGAEVVDGNPAFWDACGSAGFEHI